MDTNIKKIFINIYSMFFLCFISLSAQAVEVFFDGQVIEPACTLLPDSANQEVEFLDSSTKDFNFYPGIGPKKSFSIKFTDCTNSEFNSIKIKFRGQQESNMIGQSDYFLKVKGNNEGRLGIGLIDVDGTPLKLGGTSTLGEAHNSGSGSDINTNNILDLNFSAYVKSTPNALQNQDVEPGVYSSTVTFEVFYE